MPVEKLVSDSWRECCADDSHVKMLLYFNSYPLHNIQTNSIRKPIKCRYQSLPCLLHSSKIGQIDACSKLLWVSQDENFRFTSYTHSQMLLYLNNNPRHNIQTNAIRKPIKCRWQSLPCLFHKFEIGWINACSKISASFTNRKFLFTCHFYLLTNTSSISMNIHSIETK